MEGGEWSSFNGVYVNDEADFMAQLFPTNFSIATPHSSLPHLSYNSEDFSGGHPYIDINSEDFSHFLAANNNSSLFESLDDKAEEFGEVEHDDSKHLLPKRGSEMSLELEDSDISRKRARISDVGRRNATGSKKRRKSGLVEEDSNAFLTKQTSSGCSSEDESNLSLELNNGASSSGKTRASKGSTTDPQSLYARKRRERINERLKVLQSLVPNGTKVDISTMLEEAVQYVKFLQLQIKLLSSNDLWMYAPIAYNGMDIGLNHKINSQD